MNDFRVVYEADGSVRIFYAAKSAALVRHPVTGKHVSANNRSGDPRCSGWASLLARREATPESQRGLAMCRQMARLAGQAHKHRLAGNDDKAEAMESAVKASAHGKSGDNEPTGQQTGQQTGQPSTTQATAPATQPYTGPEGSRGANPRKVDNTKPYTPSVPMTEARKAQADSFAAYRRSVENAENAKTRGAQTPEQEQQLWDIAKQKRQAAIAAYRVAKPDMGATVGGNGNGKPVAGKPGATTAAPAEAATAPANQSTPASFKDLHNWLTGEQTAGRIPAGNEAHTAADKAIAEHAARTAGTQNRQPNSRDYAAAIQHYVNTARGQQSPTTAVRPAPAPTAPVSSAPSLPGPPAYVPSRSDEYRQKMATAAKQARAAQAARTGQQTGATGTATAAPAPPAAGSAPLSVEDASNRYAAIQKEARSFTRDTSPEVRADHFARLSDAGKALKTANAAEAQRDQQAGAQQRTEIAAAEAQRTPSIAEAAPASPLVTARERFAAAHARIVSGRGLERPAARQAAEDELKAAEQELGHQENLADAKGHFGEPAQHPGTVALDKAAAASEPAAEQAAPSPAPVEPATSATAPAPTSAPAPAPSAQRPVESREAKQARVDAKAKAIKDRLSQRITDVDTRQPNNSAELARLGRRANAADKRTADYRGYVERQKAAKAKEQAKDAEGGGKDVSGKPDEVAAASTAKPTLREQVAAHRATHRSVVSEFQASALPEARKRLQDQRSARDFKNEAKRVESLPNVADRVKGMFQPNGNPIRGGDVVRDNLRQASDADLGELERHVEAARGTPAHGQLQRWLGGAINAERRQRTQQSSLSAPSPAEQGADRKGAAHGTATNAGASVTEKSPPIPGSPGAKAKLAELARANRPRELSDQEKSYEDIARRAGNGDPEAIAAMKNHADRTLDYVRGKSEYTPEERAKKITHAEKEKAIWDREHELADHVYQVKRGEYQDKMIEHLTGPNEGKKFTAQQIADATGMHRGDVRRALDELHHEGEVKRKAQQGGKDDGQDFYSIGGSDLPSLGRSAAMAKQLKAQEGTPTSTVLSKPETPPEIPTSVKDRLRSALGAYRDHAENIRRGAEIANNPMVGGGRRYVDDTRRNRGTPQGARSTIRGFLAKAKELGVSGKEAVKDIAKEVLPGKRTDPLAGVRSVKPDAERAKQVLAQVRGQQTSASAPTTSPSSGYDEPAMQAQIAQHRADAAQHQDEAIKHGKTVIAHQAFIAKGKQPNEAQRRRAESARVQREYHHMKAEASHGKANDLAEQMHAGRQEAGDRGKAAATGPSLKEQAAKHREAKGGIAARASNTLGTLTERKLEASKQVLSALKRHKPEVAEQAESREQRLQEQHAKVVGLGSGSSTAAAARPAAPPTTGPQPLIMPGIPEIKSYPDLPQFGAKVKQAAAAVGPEGRFFGNKAYIHDVHAAYEKQNGPMPLDLFKRKLFEANRSGHVQLSRLDMVEAAEPGKVDASAIRFGQDPNGYGGSEYNLVANDEPPRKQHERADRTPVTDSDMPLIQRLVRAAQVMAKTPSTAATVAMASAR